LIVLKKLAVTPALVVTIVSVVTSDEAGNGNEGWGASRRNSGNDSDDGLGRYRRHDFRIDARGDGIPSS